MERKLIFSNKLGESTNRFEFDQESKIGYVISEGIFYDAIAIEINRKVMDFLNLNKMEGLIYDTLEMKGTFAKIIGFMKDELAPHLEKRGCKYIAIVLSSNPFTMFALKQLLKVLKSKLEIVVFKDNESAKAWILEKQLVLA